MLSPEVADTGDELRHNDPDDNAEQCQHEEVCTEHRHCTGREPREFLLYLAEQLVDLTGGTVQDKCDDQPDGDRPQDIEHIGEQSGEDSRLMNRNATNSSTTPLKMIVAAHCLLTKSHLRTFFSSSF